MMVEHPFNPSIWEAEAGGSHKFEASLVYKAIWRTARAASAKKEKKNKKNHHQPKKKKSLDDGVWEMAW